MKTKLKAVRMKGSSKGESSLISKLGMQSRPLAELPRDLIILLSSNAYSLVRLKLSRSDKAGGGGTLASLRKVLTSDCRSGTTE